MGWKPALRLAASGRTGALKKKNRIGSAPFGYGARSDAARPGWAGNRASGYPAVSAIIGSIPGQVRVLLSSPETPDNYRNL